MKSTLKTISGALPRKSPLSVHQISWAAQGTAGKHQAEVFTQTWGSQVTPCYDLIQIAKVTVSIEMSRLYTTMRGMKAKLCMRVGREVVLATWGDSLYVNMVGGGSDLERWMKQDSRKIKGPEKRDELFHQSPVDIPQWLRVQTLDTANKSPVKAACTAITPATQTRIKQPMNQG